ncbi:MAG: c-type cytochrome [Alphaproteobacteria bacterium]|nr:c-type cytochrome [Alphaproteobacteria bacterium]
MSDETAALSPRDKWFRASVAITAGIAIVAAAVGFIWLPPFQAGARFQGVWNAICQAAGLAQPAPTAAEVVTAGYKTTGVVFTPGMFQGAGAESVGRGATLALRCTMCHGARGMSQANSPNLAGQYAAVVYKELRDYKSGARTSAIMQPLVVGLSDQDMRDLAAYYDYLPRPPAYHPASAGPPPEIVVSGATMRNIPPCAACHGGLDNKTGSPWLDGQPAPYIKAQLEAFKNGTRRNDISEQMRNVARNMTPDEIDAAARYYSSQPP